jgi:Polysaccharide deacetylase
VVYELEALTDLAQQGADRRETAAAELCSAHGIDFERIRRDRWFHLMTRAEIADLSRRGFDIQLHAHRHRWSSQTITERWADIRDNIAVLSPLVGKPLEHFCYPSGSFQADQWPTLREFGIKSAMTLEPGMNHRAAPLLGLRRFIDGSNVSLVEFEAQLCGFMDLAARAIAIMRGRRLSTEDRHAEAST